MARRAPHPLFLDLMEYCRQRPGAVGARVLGETVFWVHGRVFAFLGRRERAAVTVKPPALDVERLLRRPYVRRARWIGRRGWLTVAVPDEHALLLAHALIEESYRLAATGRRGRRGAR